MKTAIEFLREKNILANEFTKFEVKFSEGFTVDFVELFEEFANQDKWISVDIEPEFDGYYLCYVEIAEECGNIRNTQLVIVNSFNQWILVSKNMKVTYWQPLPNNPPKI